jgi:hypothetical protein
MLSLSKHSWGFSADSRTEVNNVATKDDDLYILKRMRG